MEEDQRTLRKIYEIQMILSSRLNDAHEMPNESMFDSLRETNEEELVKEAAGLFRWLQRRKERTEELPKGEPAKYPEEKDDEQSDKLLGELDAEHSKVQLVQQSERGSEAGPAEYPEEKHDEQSGKESGEMPEEHSNAHLEQHSERGSEPRPEPHLRGFAHGGNSYQVRSAEQPGFDAFNSEILATLNDQPTMEQLQAQQESQITQLQTLKKNLEKELAEFVDTKMIRPSQLNALVLLIALFLLGSYGLETKSESEQEKTEAAQEKTKSQSRSHEAAERDLEMSRKVIRSGGAWRRGGVLSSG